MYDRSQLEKDPQYEKLWPIVDKYAGTGKLIPVLQETQDAFGYLPKTILGLIGREMKIPASEVFGVATFYGQFKLSPRGKNIIKVCTGTACHVRGGAHILSKVKETLGLSGDKVTTDDLLFTLDPVACIGACGMAPVIMVNDEAYGRLKPEDIPGILAKYADKGADKECAV